MVSLRDRDEQSFMIVVKCLYALIEHNCYIHRPIDQSVDLRDVVTSRPLIKNRFRGLCLCLFVDL